ncbi:MAG: hypothetical protein HKO93_00740, partial [Flavobacteriales bacterium]|nr:hypothetical protein [Flavobacteriales bacterium]
MIASAFIFFLALPSYSQQPDTDFSPDGMLVQKIPTPPGSTDSFFDIWPEVSISTNNPDQMPLHADLYVNDILVGQDQIHIVQLAGGGCPADCFASCQVDVWHPGAPPVMYGGNCVTLTPSGCKCQTGPIEMWPIQGIPLQPGDVLRLVIDPQNLVPETDETNNEIFHVYNNQTDFSNESGEFWFDNLQPGLANITPIVNIGTNSQLSLPLHADLYINGVLFAEDRMHRVKTAGGQCLGDSCINNS